MLAQKKSARERERVDFEGLRFGLRKLAGKKRLKLVLGGFLGLVLVVGAGVFLAEIWGLIGLKEK